MGNLLLSLSARRAWIEIIGYSSVMLNTAPVALRKESVDRNGWAARARVAQYVALRKESVDRNFGPLALSGPRAQSLSARRAWIEIWPS